MACVAPKPFVSAPRTCRAQLIFDTPGGKAMNVLHFQKSATWSEADLTTLEGDISFFWDANMSPLQSDQVEMTRVILTDIENDPGFQFDGHPSISVVGGRASTIMPGNVTVATKFGTGLAGRSYRGRSYHIGLTDDQCVGDSLVAGMADTIRDAWIDFIGGIASGATGGELVIVSYCQDKEWIDPLVITGVTTITTDDTLDSMRTRLAGRGM